MKLGVTKLSSAVRLALSLGAVIAVGASGTVFAQDTGAQDAANQPSQKKASTLETVVVTGSRVRRVDLETSSPVLTIDRAQIQASGKQTLGDLVQQIPAISGAATNPNVNNGGGTGAATVSLRGLGSQRTLILVNGHRVRNNDIDTIIPPYEDAAYDAVAAASNGLVKVGPKYYVPDCANSYIFANDSDYTTSAANYIATEIAAYYSQHP